MKWAELSKENGSSQAFRAASEALRDLFKVADTMELFEWVHLVSGESRRNDDGTFSVDFIYYVEGDSERSLDIEVRLIREKQLLEYRKYDPPKGVPGSKWQTLGEPIFGSDKFTVKQINGSFGRWINEGNDIENVPIFSVNLQGEQKEVVWHNKFPLERNS